jgi:hypothetical protein
MLWRSAMRCMMKRGVLRFAVWTGCVDEAWIIFEGLEQPNPIAALCPVRYMVSLTFSFGCKSLGFSDTVPEEFAPLFNLLLSSGI